MEVLVVNWCRLQRSAYLPALASGVGVVGLLLAPALLGASGVQVPGTQTATGASVFAGVAVDESGAPIRGVRLKLDVAPPPGQATASPAVIPSGARPLGWLPPPGTASPGFDAAEASGQPALGTAASRSETDEAGRFEIRGLNAGSYRLSVDAPRDVVLMSPTRVFTLTAGRTLSMTLRFERTGAITGRLLAKGKGLRAGDVRVLQWSGSLGGSRRLVAVPPPAGPSLAVTTGPNGEFGFFNLPAGEYYIVGNYLERPAPGDTGTGYVPTFYPGTTLLSEAQSVTVRSGELLGRLDFSLVRQKRSTVKVTAVDSQGRPLPRSPLGSISLRPATGTNPASIMAATTINGSWRPPEGQTRTRFINVHAGDYYAVATLYTNVDPGNGTPARMRTSDASFWEREAGFVRVTVKEGEDLDVKVRTNSGATVSGRVVVEGAVPPANVAPAARSVSAYAFADLVMGGAPSAPVNADGTFELTGVRGTVTLLAQTRGVLKSVVIDGQDVTGKPLELAGTERLTNVVITTTTNSARVQGTVTAAKAGAFVVVAFPEDPARWLAGAAWIRLARTQSDVTGPVSPAGSDTARATGDGASGASMPFGMGLLLPGRYLFAAVEDRWQTVFDAETLEKLRPQATPATLTAGETARVDLRMAPGGRQ
jgi:hypothetical protein